MRNTSSATRHWIIGDDPQRHEEVAAASRNKAGAPFQYAESLFAALAVVKSMAGLLCRHQQDLESASIHKDSKPSNAATRIAPFKTKCVEHMSIKDPVFHASILSPISGCLVAARYWPCAMNTSLMIWNGTKT